MNAANFPIQPHPLTIALLTVPRKVPYVHQTLASIFSSGPKIYDLSPVNVIVDSNDLHYLAEYRGQEAIKLHYLNDVEAKEQGSRNLHSRFCYAYGRCLALPSPGGLLVLEDDILVRNQFLNCLLETIDEMENVAGLKRYLLSLHSKSNLPMHRPLHRGEFYISSPAKQFYGTQGMYYPSSILPEVQDYLRLNGVITYKKPGDLLIGEFAHSQRNLYNTVWDLVEHVGSISTGLGVGSAYVSPTFHEPWRPFLSPGFGQS